MTKIAAVTDDGKSISQHFGRATKYVVVTVENSEIIGREIRDKAGHRQFHEHERHEHRQDERGHGYGRHSGEKHRIMFETITDCDFLLARGMGRGAYQGLEQYNIRPIVTDIPDIDSAVRAVIDGSIEDHQERLH
ncbi:MAG: NifB/NifX family molybdenum-iron cluster-binding protein [Candidatus Promineifilaceae bacterium]|jgi:predicted Fe-Mo cluster-binding NifX family protein